MMDNMNMTLSAETTALQSASDHDLRVPCYCEENAWRVVYRHLNLVGSSTSATATAGETTNVHVVDCSTYEYHVVFISNKARCCPFYHQRAKPAQFGDECVFWDYHVIVIRTTTTSSSSIIPSSAVASSEKTTINSCAKTTTTEVLDVDSWLPYPCPINIYLDETFRPDTLKMTTTVYHPRFRVIPAHQYLQYFYSDRMHMFANGMWLARPPEYPPIMNGVMYANENRTEWTEEKNENVSNLQQYIDMIPSSSSSDGKTTDERMGTVLTHDEFRARFSSI
ncbi:hypothetical protein ACHAXH_004976 [Discostella pseudostelligera]